MGGWRVLIGLMCAVLAVSNARAQKGTLIFAVESLSAQTMDPI